MAETRVGGPIIMGSLAGPRPWLVALCLSLLSYLLIPPLWQDVMTVAWATAAGLAACRNAARHREEALVWWLLGIGLLQSACGEALWTLYDRVWNIDPFPSIADAFYLAFYPFVTIALVLLIRQRAGSDRGAMLDAAVAAVGTGVLIWQYVLVPQVTQEDVGILGVVVSAAYPVLDLLLLSLVIRLAFARDALGLAGWLLTAGIGLMLVADIGFALLEIHGAYDDGHPIDLLWIASYGFMAIASVVAPTHGVTETAREILPPGRLVLLVATSLMAPALLIWQGLSGTGIDTLVIGVVSAALFALVLLRMYGLVRRIQTQAHQLEQLSTTDALTGLPNRRAWDLALPRSFALAARTREPLCIAIIDLDRFKRFNDEHGHPAGDALLRAAAQAWRQVVRDGDLLARVGGEEFALLLQRCDTAEADEVTLRVRRSVPLGQTCSIGVAQMGVGERPEDTIKRADEALYVAKASGRNRTRIASTATAPTHAVATEASARG